MSDLVFDTGPLAHFARAGELKTLQWITEGHRRLVTRAVLDELTRGAAKVPALQQVLDLGWLHPISTDDLGVLRRFADFASRLAAGQRNIGEATVLAWCKVHDGVAIIDDLAARNLAKETAIQFKGTLALVAEGLRSGVLTETRAVQLVDALRDAQAWLPCDGATFIEWAQGEGLL